MKAIHAIAAIATVTVMISFPSCNKSGTAGRIADSTLIKPIEEMQKRGQDLRNKSDFEGAIATHDSCIKAATDIHDTIQLVIALNNQGTNFRRLGDLKEASDLHYRALEISDAYSDKVSPVARKNHVRSLNGLGNILMSLNNNDAAIGFFRQALAGETALGSATGHQPRQYRLDKGERGRARLRARIL